MIADIAAVQGPVVSGEYLSYSAGQLVTERLGPAAIESPPPRPTGTRPERRTVS
jgi:hypothetical protein